MGRINRLAYAEKRFYAIAGARHPLPLLMLLVAIIMEHHKKIKKLEGLLSALEAKRKG